MTEKEKCCQGLLYDANYDAELLADREKVKEQLYDYNRLRPSQQEEKTRLLKSFWVKQETTISKISTRTIKPCK